MEGIASILEVTSPSVFRIGRFYLVHNPSHDPSAQRKIHTEYTARFQRPGKTCDWISAFHLPTLTWMFPGPEFYLFSFSILWHTCNKLTYLKSSLHSLIILTPTSQRSQASLREEEREEKARTANSLPCATETQTWLRPPAALKNKLCFNPDRGGGIVLYSTPRSYNLLLPTLVPATERILPENVRW